MIKEKISDTVNRACTALSLLILAANILAAGCGGGVPPPGQLRVLSPATASVIPGDMQSFTAPGLAPPLTWFVNDVAGGNEVVGSIDAQGNYSAPQSSPLPDSVTIRASDGSKSATANVSFVGPAAPRRLWSAAPVGATLIAVEVDSTGVSISSGAMMVAGSPETRKSFVVSFDATGIQRWQSPLTDSVIVNDVAPDQVGGAVFVGEMHSPQTVSPWIARFSGSGQLLAEEVCSDPGSWFYRVVGHGNDLYLGQTGFSAPANWISYATREGSSWCSSPVIKEDFGGDITADDVEFLVSGNVPYGPPPLHQVVGMLRIYDLSGMPKQTWTLAWTFDLEQAIRIDTPRIAESREGQDKFVYVGGTDNSQLLALTKLDMSGAVQPGWPVHWSAANLDSISYQFLTRVVPMPSGGAVTLAQGAGQTSLQDRCDIRFYDKNGSLVWQVQDGVDAVWCSSAALTSDGKFLVVAGRIAAASQWGLTSSILEKYVLPF